MPRERQFPAAGPAFNPAGADARARKARDKRGALRELRIKPEPGPARRPYVPITEHFVGPSPGQPGRYATFRRVRGGEAEHRLDFDTEAEAQAMADEMNRRRISRP